MKRIPLPVLVPAVLAIVALAVFVIWKSLPAPSSPVVKQPSGPVPLPPSQQGTRLGGQTLGTQVGAPGAPPAR